MKKKVLSMCLIFALLIPCFFLVTGCEEKAAVEVVIGNENYSYDNLTDAKIEEDKEDVIKITLNKDIKLNEAFHILNNEYEINLNGHNISFPEDTNGDGLFWVENSAKLTINGDGIINSASLKNDYSMAIWARNGGTVVINGGTFTNVGAKAAEDNGTPNNNELIYASGSGSNITINAGKFIGNYENSAHGTKYTLNIKDKQASTITVKGGEFRSYDPANSLSENPKGNFVASGYKSEKQVKNEVDWFVVSVDEAD